MRNKEYLFLYGLSATPVSCPGGTSLFVERVAMRLNVFNLSRFFFHSIIEKCADCLAVWNICVNTQSPRAKYINYSLYYKELAKLLSSVFAPFYVSFLHLFSVNYSQWYIPPSPLVKTGLFVPFGGQCIWNIRIVLSAERLFV